MTDSNKSSHHVNDAGDCTSTCPACAELVKSGRPVSLHDWTGPNKVVKYVHCRVCGIIMSLNPPNRDKPCKGPSKVGPR